MTPNNLRPLKYRPQTVEKISLAVNNILASLETGEVATLGEETDAPGGLTVEESAPETGRRWLPRNSRDAEAPVEAAAEAEEASDQPRPEADANLCARAVGRP